MDTVRLGALWKECRGHPGGVIKFSQLGGGCVESDGNSHNRCVGSATPTTKTRRRPRIHVAATSKKIRSGL